jgi:hypothetical protein
VYSLLIRGGGIKGKAQVYFHFIRGVGMEAKKQVYSLLIRGGGIKGKTQVYFHFIRGVGMEARVSHPF